MIGPVAGPVAGDAAEVAAGGDTAGGAAGPAAGPAAGDAAVPFAGDAGQPPRLDLTILSGAPTAEELAAVTATIAATLEESAADAAVHAQTGPSAWQRSQRSVRPEIVPGSGRWRGFGG